MELVWSWVWKTRILYESLVLYGSYDFGMEVWILYGFLWFLWISLDTCIDFYGFE